MCMNDDHGTRTNKRDKLKICYDSLIWFVFRWFKFTLKPPAHLGPFPLDFFGQILNTKDLETYPRTYSGHF